MLGVQFSLNPPAAHYPMNPSLRILAFRTCLLLGALCASIVGRADIMFMAFVCEDGKCIVSLHDSKTGASRWGREGEEILGHKIIAIDMTANHAAVVLEGSDGRKTILMNIAKIKESKDSLPIKGTFTLFGSDDENPIQVHMVNGVESIVLLKDGRELGLKVTQMQDGQLQYDTRLMKTEKKLVPISKGSSTVKEMDVRNVRSQTMIGPNGKTVITKVGDMTLSFH